jgi:hypothetical protein
MVRHLTIPVNPVVAISAMIIPLSGTDFRPRDMIHLALLASSMDRLKDLLGMGTGG